MDIKATIQQEIETLHVLFQEWFNGSLPEFYDIQKRFRGDFKMINPNGKIVSQEEVVTLIKNGRGKNQDIVISVDQVTLVESFNNHHLVYYRETQVEEDKILNQRLSTALLYQTQERLFWKFVQETWL